MTDLEMKKLAECTREELIDIIISMDKQLESNNSLKESIARGIKEGLTPPNTLDIKDGQIYVKSNNDWSFQDCSYAVTSQLDEFKRLAKEAQEINKEIDFVIKDKFLNYKFISGKDDRFKIGKLEVLDPFNVTDTEINARKETLKNLKLLMSAYKLGFDDFAKNNYFIAYTHFKEIIKESKLKEKHKEDILNKAWKDYANYWDLYNTPIYVNIDTTKEGSVNE